MALSRPSGWSFEAGMPIPINDVWIAACAVEARAHLITFDRDFDKVGGLKMTLLPIE